MRKIHEEDLMKHVYGERLSLGYGKRAVLSNIDFRVGKGEFIAIIGPSGAGKSTLLMALNGTVAIQSGTLSVLGEPLHAMPVGSLKRLRSRIGVIFQGYNLVKRMSVFDNVASGMLQRISLLPAVIKCYTREQYGKIYEYVRTVGMEEEALKRCDRLSGGQMQRVAIARALAQEPEIILADEPVSSLDPVSAQKVMETLLQVNRRYGLTVISNLHQLHYAKAYCTRIIGINSGRIVYDGRPGDLSDEAINEIYGGARGDEAGGPAFVPQLVANG